MGMTVVFFFFTPLIFLIPVQMKTLTALLLFFFSFIGCCGDWFVRRELFSMFSMFSISLILSSQVRWQLAHKATLWIRRLVLFCFALFCCETIFLFITLSEVILPFPLHVFVWNILAILVAKKAQLAVNPRKFRNGDKKNIIYVG